MKNKYLLLLSFFVTYTLSEALISGGFVNTGEVYYSKVLFLPFTLRWTSVLAGISDFWVMHVLFSFFSFYLFVLIILYTLKYER